MNWDQPLKTEYYKETHGFTLIELIIALAVGLVVITAIYMTFTSQQDSYIVQTQISATQQNLRGALQRMTQDIQMAGYYTNFVAEACAMNWDGLGGEESIRPVIYGCSGVTESDYMADSDVLVLIQVDRDISKLLSAAEEISAGDPTTIPGSLRDTIGEEGYYGLLVKQDLTRAEIFQVSGADGSDFNATLNGDYVEKDMVFRVEAYCYFVDEDGNLRRKNLARNDPKAQTVAENIESLRVRYHLSSGVSKWVLDENEVSKVRAVEIALLGRTEKPIKGYTDTKTYHLAGRDFTPTGEAKKYQRRKLSTTVLTRNIGL